MSISNQSHRDTRAVIATDCPRVALDIVEADMEVSFASSRRDNELPRTDVLNASVKLCGSNPSLLHVGQII